MSDVNAAHRSLVCIIILDALRKARRGNKAAKEWLVESEQILIFCAGLNIDHEQLLRTLERPPEDRRRHWVKA